jgi:hypothetical protein
MHQPLEQLPGFRRRFRITPRPGLVLSEVEDDFHCMQVTLRHAGGVATAVEPFMIRAPWTTCPGAVEQLRQTFTGVALQAFPARADKSANCTHLFDLALLAAAHAFDGEPLVYDILVSDPVDGRRRAELRRNGSVVLGWAESGLRLLEPAELAGLGLDKMRPWIDSLDAPRQEAARLLRWGNMLANGRIIPLERQSDASRMPANCYTFQPQRAPEARRVGLIRDFSRGAAQPLGAPEAAQRIH